YGQDTIVDHFGERFGTLTSSYENDSQVRELGPEQPGRLDDCVLSVAIFDSSVADDREFFTGADDFRRRPRTQPALWVSAVQDDRDPVWAGPTLHVTFLELIRDGDRVVRETQNALLDSSKDAADHSRAEERLCKLWARLVHVREDTGTEQLRQRGGKDEEVRHRVDLDDSVRSTHVA